MPRHLLSLLTLLAPLHAQDDAPAAPQPPDTDHELVGTWMGLTMDGEELEEGEFVITFEADGTGRFVEDRDDLERFTYTYDGETQRCVLFFGGNEDDAFPIDVTFDGNTVTLAPENEDIVVARRVVEEDDEKPLRPAEHDSPVVGVWEGVSRNGEPVPEGESVTLTFHADGAGESAREDTESFAWSYDASTEVCTITDDGRRMVFHVSFGGDTMTFEGEDGEMFLVMRRIAGDGEDEADFPEGPRGTW